MIPSLFLIHLYLCPPGASLVAQLIKNPPDNAWDLGLILGSGRSPGEANGSPLQYFCPKIAMDRGALQATLRGVVRGGHYLGTKPQPPYL